MAKNGKVKWIGIVIVALGLLVSVIGSFIWAQADIKAVNTKANGIVEDVDDLEEDGCKPAQKIKIKVAVLENSVQRIEKDVTEMRVEQTTRHTELMKAIREN